MLLILLWIIDLVLIGLVAVQILAEDNKGYLWILLGIAIVLFLCVTHLLWGLL